MIDTYTASSLYAGGWRAEDREQMIAEYDLTTDEADEICELLVEYAEAEAESEDED